MATPTYAAQLQLQTALDAITMPLPMGPAFAIQAAFAKRDALQRQAALDAVTVTLPADVALKLQALSDKLG
jgi:hypothetical protein